MVNIYVRWLHVCRLREKVNQVLINIPILAALQNVSAGVRFSNYGFSEATLL